MEQDKTIGEIYSKLVESEIRNQLIVNDAVRAIEEGRTPIVLTERTGHVEIIANSLKGKVANVITLTGKMSAKLRREALERLESIPEKDGFVIVATGRFVGEGFDEPRLDTLFLAMPVAWRGTIAQYAGRLHRLSDNKNEVIVYDYVDTHVGVLDRMYQKRLKGYAAIGYSLKNSGNLKESSHTIFDNVNFDQVFLKDLANAKSDIVIVSPVISNRRIMQLSHLFANATNTGVKVCVVALPESETKTNKNTFKRNVDLLKSLGVDFMAVKGVHQRFAVIDNRIVWYGNMNLMSYGRSNANMMRLTSPEIASELLDLLKEDV
jgi:superfamily II DNA or RNA helicase